MNQITENEQKKQTLTLREWGSALLAVILLAVDIYSISGIFAMGTIPVPIIITLIVMFFVVLGTIAGAILPFFKRTDLGVSLTFFSMLLTGIAATTTLQGRALSLTFVILIVTFIGLGWLFTPRMQRTYAFIAALTLILIWLVEWLNPSWRRPLGTQVVGPFAVILFAIVFGAYLITQASRVSLRTKLIGSFLAVLIIPLTIISYITYNTSSTALTNDANQKLEAAAAQVANQIDQFIIQNLESVRTAAQYTDVVNLLRLPESQRANSITQGNVQKILTTLSRQDPIFISSVAVFDINGTDVADNNFGDIGTNKSSRAYFRETLKSGLPYVSDVEFSASSAKPSIYFSAPVRDANGKVLGIIRIRYAASILQKFIAQHDGDVGETSYAVLLDSNHVRLAHGLNRERVFKSVVPLAPETLRALQDQGLMPPGTPEELATNFRDFEDGIKNIDKTPYFASDTDGDGALEESATSNLTFKPWKVIFIQNESVFLAPVTTQTRGNLLAVALITLVVGVAGFFFSQTLSGPVVRLTETAEAIAAGNINIQAKVETNDEIGKLAATFNNMTAQLRDFINTLEQRVAARTKDLETVAEVSTATSTILETNSLLEKVVELTKERFNLYHSHIYLLDNSGENLVLAAGAGEPGRQMVAEGRSIPLSREQSLVARAARERKGVTVNDVTLAPDFLPNPLLPDTHSELAVPMLVGEKVIGVFDIQSEQVGRFTDSDISIQTTLAAQLATSVQNVRQFEQSKARAGLETLVNTIGQKIQRAATVEETLQTAARELGLALGASHVKASIGESAQQSNSENAGLN